MSAFGTVEQALADLAAGRPVVVVDDEDEENEGDLIVAAELATPELVGFMIRWTSGVLCAPLLAADCDRLGLPPMHHRNEDRKQTAFTVSVDARDKTTTGISAAELAHTIRLLADARTRAETLERQSRDKAAKLVGDAERQQTEIIGSITRDKTVLEKKIDELRTFEREYRTRLKTYLESQLRDLGERGSAAPSDSRSSSNGGYAASGYGQRADAGS